MKLRVYLAEREMTLKDFSKIVDFNPGYISLVCKGKKKPGKKLARNIEKATNGQVTFSTENIESSQRIEQHA